MTACLSLSLSLSLTHTHTHTYTHTLMGMENLRTGSPKRLFYPRSFSSQVTGLRFERVSTALKVPSRFWVALRPRPVSLSSVPPRDVRSSLPWAPTVSLRPSLAFFEWLPTPQWGWRSRPHGPPGEQLECILRVWGHLIGSRFLEVGLRLSVPHVVGGLRVGGPTG